MSEDDFAQLAALRNQQHHDYYERMNGTNVGKSVGELTSRIEALEAALQWYGDTDNYEMGNQTYDANDCKVYLDGGERARKALGDKP